VKSAFSPDQSVLNFCSAAASHTPVPRLCRHRPSSRVRIVLQDINGDVPERRTMNDSRRQITPLRRRAAISNATIRRDGSRGPSHGTGQTAGPAQYSDVAARSRPRRRARINHSAVPRARFILSRDLSSGSSRFSFDMPSDSWRKRVTNFESKFTASCLKV